MAALLRSPVCAPSTSMPPSTSTLRPQCWRTAGALARPARRPAVLVNAAGGPPSGGMMAPELKRSIDELISKNKVVAFIKGTRTFPQCGFSNTVVQILNAMNAPYETVDVLADDKVRSGMKEYSQWPTFPQVYIDGEFYGGCDIMIQAYQSGELKEVLEVAMLD